MAWVIACMLSIGAVLLLYASGKCSRLALEIAVASVLIALAGYSWEGSPDMPGNPVASVIK